MSKRQDQVQLSFNPTCPSGGSWYACGETFLGCCASDACTPNGCSEGSLRTVSFDKDQYEKFPDATCGPGSKFYTCASGPTFWGCCKSNPCAAVPVCRDGDLTGAFVGSPAQSAYYMAGESVSTTTMQASSSTIATLVSTPGTLVTSATSNTLTSISSTGEAASSSTSTVEGSSSKSDSHTAAIAGGSAGGGVIIALLVCWLLYYLCYVKRSRAKHNDELDRRQSDLAIASMTDKMNKAVTSQSAPPVYSSPDPNSYIYPPHEPNTYAYQRDTASPTSGWKPQHRHGVSELSGETIWRGELESPMPSPNGGSPPHSPRFMSAASERNGGAHRNGSWEGQALGIHSAGEIKIVGGRH